MWDERVLDDGDNLIRENRMNWFQMLGPRVPRLEGQIDAESGGDVSAGSIGARRALRHADVAEKPAGQQFQNKVQIVRLCLVKLQVSSLSPSPPSLSLSLSLSLYFQLVVK